ncbi:histone PARylation factor 1 isoform X2 [Lycorma delicatula]|uniref:histone PARylation factor 1 isoform X2 n=1 Tax=Lycorma delicatula TaxID=130591 RepID=UPI003F510F81
MSEDIELKKYESDPRTPCRYGVECYQKNSQHLQKFKHPPKKNLKTEMVKRKEEESTSAHTSKYVTTAKPKKKNLLTDWLKPPSNKKQKLEKNIDDKKIRQNESHSSSKEKTAIRDNTDKDNRKQTEILNTINEVSDQEVHKKKKLDNQGKNETDNKSNEIIDRISIIPLEMDVKTKIKTYFLVDMPDDFYKFWSFCESVGNSLLSQGNPLDAFKIVGLKLVGPFDVLANKFNNNIIYNSKALLRHYRFYYDPPEFQTVLVSNNSNGYHLGYFRDDPKENPVFVASNCAAENCIIKSVAENLFGAVNVYLEEYKKNADPFAKLKVVKLQNSLTIWAKKENITLSTTTAAMRKRETKVVTRTFHKAGLVVPYNKKTELGYRELAENDATLKNILKNIVDSKTEEERKDHFSKLYPIITFANIANDECDFGTSLELALDLFSFGSPLLHETIKRLMTTSYELLGKSEFATIIEAHLEDRKKGSNLSILNKT